MRSGQSTRAFESREVVVATLLRSIREAPAWMRALIGIDGFDGAGKSYLAKELARLASATPGRPVVNVSIDGFHRPRSERRAAGAGAEGFYRGSYRYDVFREAVVERLRAGRPIVPRVWDVSADEPVHEGEVSIPDDGIVLVDGIFLHRPELVEVWDASLWLDVPLAVSVPRACARLATPHDPDPEAAENSRYVGGQRLYVAEANPATRATWILDNTDLQHPWLWPVNLSRER